jgi:hypothetical protein
MGLVLSLTGTGFSARTTRWARFGRSLVIVEEVIVVAVSPRRFKGRYTLCNLQIGGTNI